MDSPPAVYLLAADAPRLQAFAAQLRTHLAQGLQLHCVGDAADAARLAARPHALYLLLGLPLRPGAAADDAARDQALRAALLRLGIGFQVIHADAPQSQADQVDQARQAHQALSAIAQRLGAGCVQSWPALPQPALRQRRWTGPCEKCSDPDCEHQLFQSLLAAAQKAPGQGLEQ